MKKLILALVLLNSIIFSLSAQENNRTFGASVRGGYAFNYDAFTYGASVMYKGNLFGVTLGVDGYKIPNKILQYTDNEGTLHEICSDSISTPMWDIRMGLVFGSPKAYFAIGGIVGKWNVEGYYPSNIVMNHSQWLWDKDQQDKIYGGFITFIIPFNVGNKFDIGANIDLAFTNKTGFNTCIGFNITIPLK